MPGLAAVGPTLVVAGAVDAALPAAVAAAAAVLVAVVVVLEAVVLGAVVVRGSGTQEFKLGAALHDVLIDQEAAGTGTVRERHRLLHGGCQALQEGGEGRDPGTAREEHDIRAAVNDEVAIGHLDPDLPALDHVALHPGGEPAMDGVGDPDAVPLRRRAGDRSLSDPPDRGAPEVDRAAVSRSLPVRTRAAAKASFHILK